MTAFSSGASQFCRGQRTTTEKRDTFYFATGKLQWTRLTFSRHHCKWMRHRNRSRSLRKSIQADRYLDFFCVTLKLCGTKDPWSTRCYEGQTIFGK